MIAQDYDAWVTCITVDCGIPLTPDYIEKRLSALRDESDAHTERFLKMYGEEHLERVIGWFERAREEHAD
jgi:hypothetical protein